MGTTRTLPYKGCLPDRDDPGQRPLLSIEWHAGVKTWPCRNFVAGGKNAHKDKKSQDKN